MPHSSGNPYLSGTVLATFVRTALPIMLLTSVNGLLTVADAILLGLFVGPEALAAVTLVFPLSMLLIALATMVASGMATLLGQRLGAGRAEEARRYLAGAHGLALVVCAAAVGLFGVLGRPLTLALAGGSSELAGMGHGFIGIAVLTSPLLFLLSVQSDALRSEGRIGFMALAGLLVSLANLGLNAVLIVGLDLGVTGSAWGTALAQSLALAAILAYRALAGTPLGLRLDLRADWRFGWGGILALGAPRSLSFIGIALGSATVIAALRLDGGSDQDATVAAYGVVTRLMTFAYLPLLGMALALQAMVCNSHGAGLRTRSDATLRLVLRVSLAYSALVEAGLIVLRHAIGRAFVEDLAVVAEVARILPVYVALYVAFGPCLMIANYFQSLGDARRSALLSLARTYLFAIPLSFALPLVLGESGIWFAQPAADGLLLATTGVVLLHTRRAQGQLGRVEGPERSTGAPGQDRKLAL
ncbi:Multi antimicrobial extrusion protein MatE [Rubellimicrobium mesophilum DSM 19309]|uniref:Multidrug export protein MepA n=1 Tax=Rubellimicrobium mesophilum DSM 19309 TaxID=442562 RepID=A0A017HQZ3_9RHOB|nr:MATE family efflux transporter [Rubellimicrobium mesophilum]EYD76174.1 Multi antimicrobial extrusion protein MatE [Rubellimicrobium mesophilum DSM 19309]